jgi:two-component system, NarL family, invasion response regulator UvrY
MARPYCILLADDHVGFRREVRKILEEFADVKVTGEAGNRRELLALMRQSPPELVILDMAMPDLRAGEGAQLIKMHSPETKVLFTVLYQEHAYLSYGLAAGAAGVLPKQFLAKEIARAITTVRQGKIYLPPRVPGKILPPGPWQGVAGPELAGWDNC